MRSWIETHPYLLWSLVLLALLATVLALCPRRLRWSALLSGLLALPFAVTFAWEAQPYWSPARVWPSFVSLEDFIFSFASAGLTWLVATWPLHRRVALDIRPRRLLLQYLLVWVLGGPLTMGAFLLDSKPMPRTLMPVIVVGLLLLYLRPSLWTLALWGLTGYTLVHCVILRTAFTLTPVWAGAWNVRSLWGPKFWAIPVDEIVWSAVFGAIWPVFTAYLFNARLLLPDQESRLASE